MAKGIELLQRADIDILASRITLAHCRGQRAAREIRIGEAEQVDRAGIGRQKARTVIIGRTDGEAVARRVQRYRITERIVRLQPADIDILAALIALAEGRFQRAAGEIRIGEAEQVDRAGIRCRTARRTVIAGGPDRQAVARRVQGHRGAELILSPQPPDSAAGTADITGAQNAGIGPGRDVGGLADDDVLRVQQQVAASAHFDIRKIGAAQIFGRGNLHRSAARCPARVDAAQEGGQRLGPHNRRAAAPAVRTDIDPRGIVDKSRPRTGQRAAVRPAAQKTVVIGLCRVRRLAALKRPANAHLTAFDTTARGQTRRQQAHIARRHIDAPAAPVQAVGEIIPGGGHLPLGGDRDRSAMGQARSVGDPGRGLGDTARSIGNLTARPQRAHRLNRLGQRQALLRIDRNRPAGLARGADPTAQADRVGRDVNHTARPPARRALGQNQTVTGQGPGLDLNPPAPGRARSR